MGGIVGNVVIGRSAGKSELNSIASAMSGSLSHRGSTNSGIWADEEHKLIFGNKRIAIQDSSDTGLQPMLSADGRYVLSINGEIYNHLELREELKKEKGAQFKGSSDTETVVEAIAAWGIVKTLQKLNGMFAFSVWDKAQHALYIARDRFGQKPLYYGWNNNNFMFASELRAIKNHPNFVGKMSPNSIGLYFRHGYIPSPFSVYENIFKLSPGSYLSIDGNSIGNHTNFWPVADTTNAMSPTKYWQEERCVTDSLNTPFVGGEAEAIGTLRLSLFDAVKRHMIAEAPLGVSISDSANSALIAAIAQQVSEKPINTYSVAIEENQHKYIKKSSQIAKHLGTNHHEFLLKKSETINSIPALGAAFDEPFSSPVQILTMMFSKKASENNQVCLTGEGGDELFGGNSNHYIYCNKIGELYKKTPPLIRKGAAFVAKAIPTRNWNAVLEHLPFLCPDYLVPQKTGENIHKLACSFEANDINNLYKELLSTCHNPKELIPESTEPHYIFDNKHAQDSMSFTQYMMMTDVALEIPDDAMTRIDRLGMFSGLEMRSPFLDNKLFEFAWSLPMEMKITGKNNINILHQLLYKYVPANLCDYAPKNINVNFTRQLIDYDLKAWADDLLSKQSLEKSGLFDVPHIRQMWLEHTSRNRNRQQEIWSLLMFQSWLQEN
ncbi:MAG: asparagine synthase (glutamine-hydrolyzing) [Alphaproteobacteria bacterium]|nr:asparagine synthase (glutamine-hydrolyzing) [Alphaproteobacteria bacterium]